MKKEEREEQLIVLQENLRTIRDNTEVSSFFNRFFPVIASILEGEGDSSELDDSFWSSVNQINVLCTDLIENDSMRAGEDDDARVLLVTSLLELFKDQLMK